MLVAHIPDVVIIGILLIAFIASAMMGYGFGRQGKRALGFKALFAVMLAIAIGLILDLDRPQRGLIRVNLAPLQNVQRIMQAVSSRRPRSSIVKIHAWVPILIGIASGGAVAIGMIFFAPLMAGADGARRRLLRCRRSLPCWPGIGAPC